ncbi:hypothetical protein [Planococcus donghaensis]|uniref:hypothetical protein n=1 Tax=Planococcus donghaensis TaxID=414778 RepID=UPI003735049F
MSNYEQSNPGSDSKNSSLPSIFLDADHYSRFDHHLNQLNKHQQVSPEYQSALFILTSTDELYRKTISYFGSHGFSHLDMFEEQDFSSGYGLMVKAAGNLFGFYEYELSLAHLVGAIDDELFPVFIQALIIRKHGLQDLG